MKQLTLFIFLIGIVIVCRVHGQSVIYRRWNADSTAHTLIFGVGKDGAFYEDNPPYSEFGRISYGSYHEERKFFLLTSHPDIMLGSDYEIPTDRNFSRHTDVDSLCIEVVTPYEHLMDYIDSIPYQAAIYDGYRRIYRYAYNIKCANDSTSQVFEHLFNAQYSNEKNNQIRVYIPSYVIIQSVSVKIFWAPDCDDVLLERNTPFCWSEIQLQRQDENLFHFEFPQFNYFFLSYKRYNQFKVMKKGRNKIELDGTVFARVKKMTSRLELILSF